MLDCCQLKILSYLYPFLVYPFYVHGRYLQKHQRDNFALPKIVFEVSITILSAFISRFLKYTPGFNLTFYQLKPNQNIFVHSENHNGILRQLLGGEIYRRFSCRYRVDLS